VDKVRSVSGGVDGLVATDQATEEYGSKASCLSVSGGVNLFAATFALIPAR